MNWRKTLQKELYIYLRERDDEMGGDAIID